MTISALRPLPLFCLLCGQEAVRAETLRLTRGSDDLDDAALVASFLLRGPLRRIFRWGLQAHEELIELKLPFCRACESTDDSPRVRHVDWDTSSAKVLVHVNFKQRLIEAGYLGSPAG